MTVADAVASIVGGCLDLLAMHEPDALAGADPEGVHRMRVAVRKLRSALRLNGGIKDDPGRTALDAELSWFAGTLAPARELDVFLNEVLPAARAKQAADPAALAAFAAQAGKHRAAAYRQVAEVLTSDRYKAIKEAIIRLCAEPGPAAAGEAAPPATVEDWAPEVLDRLRARTLKCGRGFRHMSPEDRHKLRVAAKRLRYAADFFEGVFRRKTVRRFIDALRRVQDGLGRANDLATLHRFLPALARDADDPAAVTGAAAVERWAQREYAVGDDQLVEAWRSFGRARPFWRQPARTEDEPAVKTVLLSRHAKSSWEDASLADVDRPLAPRGVKAAGAVGRYVFRTAGMPDLVLCSTAARARQTWERMSAAAPLSVPVRYLDELYMATPERLLTILARLPDDVDCVLVIGHNPGFEELLRLLGSSDPAACEPLPEKFPTAAVAEVRLEIPRWWDIAPGRGRLHRFITPKDLPK
jgi:phosphohistidine phosphatase SixA/CHAD domain-containing protein